MSGSTTIGTTTETVAQKVRAWGTLAVSVYVLTIFLVTLVFAFLSKNENLLITVAGGVIVATSGVVGYWVGSSVSSDKKSEVIASQLPLATNPVVAGGQVVQTTTTSTPVAASVVTGPLPLPGTTHE